MTGRATRYAAGAGVLLQVPDLTVLASVPTTHPVVEQCWHAMSTAPDFEDLLDLVLAHGLRSVPSFAILSGEAPGRLFLRGDLRVAVSRADDAEPLRPRGWTDLPLQGNETVTLDLTDGADEPSLHLVAGVVAAGAVRIGEPVGPVSSNRGIAAAERAEAAAIPSVPAAGVRTSSAATLPADALPAESPPAEASAADAPEPVAVTSPDPELTAVDASERQDFAHLFSQTRHPSPDDSIGVVPTEVAAFADDPRTAGPATAGRATADRGTAGPAAPPPDAVDRPPPPPAPREPGPGAVPAQVGPGPGRVGQPGKPVGFIDEVPWSGPSQPTDGSPGSRSAAPARPHPEVERAPTPGHGMTVNRAQLKRGMVGLDGPLVLAARCPQGHLCPAHAALCRVCRQEVPPQQAFEAHRPMLGRLILPSGDAVLLDRGMILGRAPRLPANWEGEQPNLVQLDDPDNDVSGQHLEIRLDVWHVLVRDLNSTNGSEVISPDGEVRKLRPHEPTIVEPGSALVLAEVMTMRFEAIT